ncbi:MAG: SoxR reducing system RseC family protein [Planctomycetota bacterium]
MIEDKFCQDCNQRQNCQEVYQKLGKTKGPSVVFNTVAAFLLPILVFIASLAAFEAIFGKAGLSFVSALSVTFVCILIIKAIKSKISKNK